MLTPSPFVVFMTGLSILLAGGAVYAVKVVFETSPRKSGMGLIWFLVLLPIAIGAILVSEGLLGQVIVTWPLFISLLVVIGSVAVGFGRGWWTNKTALALAVIAVGYLILCGMFMFRLRLFGPTPRG